MKPKREIVCAGGVRLANPRNAVCEPDGHIVFEVDYSDPQTPEPEPATYVLVDGDEAPAAVWLRALLDKGLVPPPREADEAYLLPKYWEDLRIQRNRLLKQSDPEMLPDRLERMTAEEGEAWRRYRQALRDLPASCSDPRQACWPEHPRAPKRGASDEGQ